jgi:nucleoid-associated protein YgaU
MTREHKLALIVGFALVLIVGVLVSDHLSSAERDAAAGTDLVGDPLDLQPERFGALQMVPQAGFADEPPVDQTFATRERDSQRINVDRSLAVDTAPLTPTGSSPIARQPGYGLESARLPQLPAARLTVTDRANDDDDNGIREFVNDPRRSAEPDPHRDAARPYVVRDDDNLWRIAEREYGDGGLYAKLQAFNFDRVGSAGTIREGATLLLPPRHVLDRWRSGEPRFVREASGRETSVRDRGNRRSSAPPRPEPPRPETRVYVVQPNETLSAIAQRELGSARRWRDVVDLNGGDIPEDGMVREGQRIVLPAE